MVSARADLSTVYGNQFATVATRDSGRSRSRALVARRAARMTGADGLPSPRLLRGSAIRHHRVVKMPTGARSGLCLAFAITSVTPACSRRSQVGSNAGVLADGGDPRDATADSLRALVGESALGDGGVGLGLGPNKGLSAEAACKLVATLPEVATRRGFDRAQVTSTPDATENMYACTGSRGECLHWCRVEWPGHGRPSVHRYVGVDPHEPRLFWVCLSDALDRCHDGQFESLDAWRRRGVP